jgi:hypothetical protein
MGLCNYRSAHVIHQCIRTRSVKAYDQEARACCTPDETAILGSDVVDLGLQSFTICYLPKLLQRLKVPIEFP